MPSLADALANFKPRSPVAAATEEPAAVAAAFPVKTRVHARKQRDALAGVKARDRLALRKHIRPENAAALLAHLPESEDDRTHALIAGDFIFCDFVEAVARARGNPPALTLATLSLSAKNAAALERFAQEGVRVALLVSHYFQKTSATIFRALELAAERSPALSIRVGRSHCKVTLFDYPDFPLVVESSANLRSSRNLEQVTLFCDRELLNFHAGWIAEAAEAYANA